MKYRRLFAKITPLFVVLVGLPLTAQDITVSNPAWFDVKYADGDHPPEFRSKASPKYPDKVGAPDELGYVSVSLTLDEKGNSSPRSLASDPIFELAVDPWLADLRFRPATKAGEAVKSSSWFAVIFNPKTAGEKRPEATPRLLAVAPAIVSPELIGNVKWGGFLWATFAIDEEGRPGKVVFDLPDVERFREAVETSLHSWKFAPARRDGRPYSANVHLPFLIQTARPRTMPVLKSDPYIGYPSEMREKRLRGEVKVQFEVDVDGRVINPIVLDTTNVGFNQGAIRGVLTWKFTPGTEDGQPKKMKVQETIAFHLSRAANPNQLSLATKDMLRTIGEALHYDVAPVMKGTLHPVYPYALLRDHVAGKANVRYRVNDSGWVDGNDVLSASRPEFALALIAALESAEFTPAINKGQATVALLTVERAFKPDGLDGVPNAADVSMYSREKDSPQTIVSWKTLETPLKPLVQQIPVFPYAAANRKIKEGDAVIEIIVDEEGSVRLPRIVKASDPAFGYAAVQAAAAWRFEPPRAAGKAVATRARLPFTFSLEKQSSLQD